MPCNKNQHFVPRCYLSPFTDVGEGKAINLFNLDHNRAIRGAPVKGQCSGDYFYGDDLVLEKLLQTFEGRYAARLRAILEPNYELTEHDGAMLKEFWLLQYLRTDASSRTMVAMVAQMDDDMGGLPPGYLTNIKEAVQTAMHIFFENSGSVADLNIRLVRNRMDRPFITSDNPAVMTNRWHLTDRRAELIVPGLLSAGMTGFLPLSSDVLCAIYDSDLYSVMHQRGWVDLVNSADLDAFNEQQILACQHNVYFQRWNDRRYVAELVGKVGEGRPTAGYELTYAILDGAKGDSKVYRAVTALEAKGHQESIVHSSRVLPTPSRWPSMIRWRSGGVVYDSGNGTGFSRKQTRDPSGGYTRLRVRP